MGWTWNSFGLLGIVAMVLAVAMAAFVYAARRDRPQNRRLALLLAAEGVIMGFGGGLLYFATDQATAEHLQMATIAASLLLPLIYLRFLATLQTPLVRWLQPVPVQVALFAMTAGGFVWWYLEPAKFIALSIPTAYTAWEIVPGAFYRNLNVAVGILAIFALAAALHSYWRARPDSARRKRTKAFAIAFGLKDSIWILLLLVLGPVIARLPSQVGIFVYLQLFPLMTIVFVLLLAIGILRTQLFKIELHVKWTLNKGTLAGAMVVLFFLAKEVIEQFIPVDGVLLGVLAAGAVGLGFGPVQKMAHHLANRLMPGVEETPEYLESKRTEVYKAAVEGIWEDGQVEVHERRVLARLREQLGIPDDLARRVEKETLQALSRPSVAPRAGLA